MKERCTTCSKKTIDYFSHKVTVKGKVYQYFMCNPCNTARHRKYSKTKEGNINRRKAVAKSIKKYPEKQRAREKLYYAVKTGKIKKRKICTECKSKRLIEGHHEDYSKPLEVIWLCRKCHSKRHHD